jgi:hypothetical protein
MDRIVIDRLDAALYAEAKARIAVIAIGEEWKALHEARREPTEEEIRLHVHLVREWQRAADVVTKMFNKPLR